MRSSKVFVVMVIVSTELILWIQMIAVINGKESKVSMIKLLTAIAVICVLMTAVGIIYCYIKGIDPARLDEGADNSISVDYRYFGEGINKGIAIAVAEKYEETYSLEKRRHKMTRTGKYIMNGLSRFHKYAQGILQDETIDLMELNGYRPIYTKAPVEPSDEEIQRLLDEYDPETVAELEQILKEPLSDKKSVKFQPGVYAAAKEWAKEDGVSLGEYINKAVDNLNRAMMIQKDMLAKLEEAKAISSKYE